MGTLQGDDLDLKTPISPRVDKLRSPMSSRSHSSHDKPTELIMPERKNSLLEPSGFDLEKLTQMENSQLSKILTHKLVTQVTKSMN